MDDTAPTHRPTDPAQIVEALRRPFAQRLVELKPAATTKPDADGKQRALAMPYVDARAYMARLDQAAGFDGWAVSYRETSRGLICALTIGHITREDVGDYPAPEKGRDGVVFESENPTTTAAMQAFKRACAAFGLGRYLYALPQVWADYDPKARKIIHPGAVVAQMYQALQLTEAD